MSRTDAELLNEALHHFHLASTHSKTGMGDQLVIDAVSMRLVAALEALHRLDAKVLDSAFGDTWTLMWGMRNRITHGYGMVDPAVIQRTVDIDVPLIAQKIEATLAQTTLPKHPDTTTFEQ